MDSKKIILAAPELPAFSHSQGQSRCLDASQGFAACPLCLRLRPN
jgi:hypothetical protein